MRNNEIFRDAFDRVGGIIHKAVDGASDSRLSYRIEPGTNSIAWLVWHLTRVQDAYFSRLSGGEQVWSSAGWVGRFKLDLPEDATGYGFGPDEVTKVVASAELLAGYYDAVREMVHNYLDTVEDDAFDKVVDSSRTPAVTLAGMLQTILSDSLQHAGQAAFVTGIADRVGQ